jgi:hypothetical protein
MGEDVVLVRYLDKQAPVRLAFVPKRPGFRWEQPASNNYIDDHAFAKLRRLRMNPSGLCTDTEFLRRAYLDLLGVLPTAAEARAFVGQASGPNRARLAGSAASDKDRFAKRARLIEELLQRQEHADFWALKWADILRNEEKVLDPKGIKTFHRWIRDSLAQNKPIDRFVREIVSGIGSTYSNAPANYYRALREPTARSEATAQLFLGTRLGCARCHNHPFDHWTQADYYDWAGVFAKVQYRVVENTRRDGLDTHEFVGEQIVYEAAEGEVTNPRTGKPAQARLLGTSVPMTLLALGKTNAAVSDVSPESTARFRKERKSAKAPPRQLGKLAAWLTAPENELFAKAQVNRVWFHLMGRGLVDPVDDFRATNPASHPALLDQLSADFVKRGFDLRWLIRLIMNSRVYQLSAEPTSSNQEDEVNYSHVLPRRLTAEQLFDAQHQILEVAPAFRGHPVGLRASQLPGGSPVRRGELKAASSEKFLALFGKPARVLACECERSNETTLNQVFQLVSGPSVQQLLSHENNHIGALLKANQTNAEIVGELYWATLSRPPSADELAKTVTHIERARDRRDAFEDLTWALLNAKEFVLRR